MKTIYEEIQIRIEIDEVEDGIAERERLESMGYKTGSTMLSDEKSTFYLLIAKRAIK